MNHNCHGASLADLVERLEKAEKQRDELLHALEYMVKWVELTNMRGLTGTEQSLIQRVKGGA